MAINKWVTITISVLFSVSVCRSQSTFSPSNMPLQVIFDTDFGPDYDDVGAITLLHGFADSNQVQILATMASSRHHNVAAALNIFNTYFNRPSIPIGVVGKNGLELGDKQHWTDSVIKNYPHQIQNNGQVPEALYLYRKVLASQPDHSVTIITVGFLTNLADLLNSKPDSLSPMDGVQLVKKKVVNLVSMGGRFPSGREFNLDQDVVSTRKVLNDWPGPILFSGFEIGQKIKTGLPLVQNSEIQRSPVKDVFAICIPLAKEDSVGRMSWDETAVFVAVSGWEGYYELETGTCEIADNGFNSWTKGNSSRARLVEKMSPEEIARIINRLMMHQPLY